MKPKYAILILAAGESKRLGQPKQLVQFKSKTLLQNTLDLSQVFNNADTYVVLGAHYDQIASSLSGVSIIYNEEWSKGMGQSISKGVQAILPHSYDGVLVLLCDQPFLSKGHMQQIFDRYENSKFGIVASSYDSQIGAPCFFDNKYFEKLVALGGDKGAKSLIKENIEDCSLIEFKSGHIDIDTPKDLENLSANDQV